MKLDRHTLTASLILIGTLLAAVVVWIGTLHSVREQRLETRSRGEAALTARAAVLADLIGRQISGIDASLRDTVTAWQQNPQQFDLNRWRYPSGSPGKAVRDVVLADASGVIRQCTIIDAVNRSVASLDYVRALSDVNSGQNALFVGGASIDPVMRQWHLNIARTLRRADGSLAGFVASELRIASVINAFALSNTSQTGLLALIGLKDGRLRGALGPATINPDLDIADSAMFQAIRHGGDGLWVGPSATDSMRRVHAYHEIPGLNLTVMAAVGEAEMMGPADTSWRDGITFAALISMLLLLITVMAAAAARRGQRRAAQLAADQAIVATAQAQVAVARAEAAAKAERLGAMLRGMADGVSMVDSRLCLVEWNDRFPELAGLPAEELHIGLPMNDIPWPQAGTGPVGPNGEGEAHRPHRPTESHDGTCEVMQRLRPDGRTVELRRIRLPEGGFVTLYSDVTEHKRTERALQQALAEAATATAGPSEPVAMVGHDVRSAKDDEGDAFPPTQPDDAVAEPAPPARPEPNAVAPVRPVAAPMMVSSWLLPRTRILLIDDSEADQDTIAQLLRRAGHAVDTAGLGAAAVLAARSHPYDLILVESGLPGMGGVDLARAVRALEQPASATPIVAMTATRSAVETATFRLAGINGVLQKPITMEGVADAADLHVWKRGVWTQPTRGRSA